MTTTTKNNFTVASQSGANSNPWTGLSNLEYVASGEASEEILGTELRSNSVYMSIPQETLPAGARFDSMTVYLDCYHSNIFQGRGGYDVKISTTKSSGQVDSDSVPSGTTYETKTFDGDKSYWNLGAYSIYDIIDDLRDGSNKIQIWFTFDTEGPALSVHLQTIEVEITYTDTRGERGAILCSAV